MMKKKGFTLVELLAVIAILAIIIGITSPIIIDVINGSRDKLDQEEKKLIENAALRYKADNIAAKDCISAQKLAEEGYLKITKTNITGCVSKEPTGTYKYSVDCPVDCDA